jgi:sigma-B regulation protein RsbU (phosphoserine phosphatase)
MPSYDPAHLRLTDFMDLPTLQEIQDSFAAVANVKASITDAQGNRLTSPTPAREFLRRQRAIAETQAAEGEEGLQKEGTEFVAPIVVSNQRLGTLRMSPIAGAAVLDEARVAALAEKTGLDPRQVKSLATQLLRSRHNLPAAVSFLYLLANAIARLCFQEFQLRRRIDELTAVYNVAMMLADARDLQKVLQRTTELVCEVMNARASSIRLIDAEHDELVIKAVHNLSARYLAKGPIRLSQAEADREALSPRGYAHILDMSSDPRVHYPEESAREGIVSMLSAGMRYKGRPIGVLRVYTSERKTFSQLEIDLLKAVAAQAAAAIENARLNAEALAAVELAKQVQTASEVQQRMIPRTPPTIVGVDLACVYVPCHALGGDLYDFIELPRRNTGLVMADVSGKGIPASLIMASVRAALRAHADNLYFLNEVMRRVNRMLCRDSEPGEFVTCFYGVLDEASRRLTYCNAGHPPPLLLRDGRLTELAGSNLVLGVDPDETYEQRILELKAGDTLLLYTDGLTDAMNFQQESFGRQRLHDALLRGGDTAALIAQNILWEMRRFTGLAERTDDVTMVVVKTT